MKSIFTSKGEEILVDDADYTALSKFKWHLDDHGYAVRSQYLGFKNGKKTYRQIHMSRQILGLKLGDGKIGHHKVKK